MKKINLLILLLLTAVMAYPQHRLMQVYSAGEVAYEINTAQVDSVVFRASLANTMWKLVSIVNIETGEINVPEPKECEKCYLLLFDTNAIFSTHSSSNEIKGIYAVDYTKNGIHFTGFFGTEVGEIGDGYLYVEALHNIHSFSCKANELKLYYNDKKNNLIFKKIEEL